MYKRFSIEQYVILYNTVPFFSILYYIPLLYFVILGSIEFY